MARPRKAGKRTKSGRIKERPTPPEAIEPTPEFMARKAKAGMGEIANPLSYMAFTDSQRQALDAYFKARLAAGWGEAMAPASLTFEGDYDRDKDSKPLPLEPASATVDPDERDQQITEWFNRADRALLAGSSAAHRAVVTAFGFRASGIRFPKSAALELGADILGAHFGYQQDRAA